MARFDVFQNSGQHSVSTPFLLNVQADLLEDLDTCVVIPLRRIDAFEHVHFPEDLVPLFIIDGIECLLETPKLAAVPRRILKAVVTNIGHEHMRIVTAMDRLFQDF